jgi:hypothetical protein
MFCENCGNKIDDSHKFCTKCGYSAVQKGKESLRIQQPVETLNEKWWHRLLKVFYIILYIPLFVIIPLVWTENSSSYGYYSGYTETTGLAIWYSILTLVIYLVVARLIKLSVLYVAFGQRPGWKKQFKKLF